ncbi:MAG: histidine kinase N-terminal 7TM domain-containing protein [Chloroflexota bacterium]
MTAEQTIYITPYLLSIVISLGIVWYTYWHLDIPGGRAYSLFALGQALTTTAFILELFGTSLAVKSFWDEWQWVTLAWCAIAFLVFCMNFTGSPLARDRRYYWALAMLFVAFVLFTLTNRYHNLLRFDETILTSGTFPVLDYAFTPASMTMSFILIGLGVAAVGLLVRYYVKVGPPYRGHILIVMSGVAIPVVGGILTVSGVLLTDQRDVTPISIIVGNVLVVWGLTQYHLFRLMPIARTIVLEQLQDAVLVVDRKDRIIDLNPSGRRLVLRYGSGETVVGQSFGATFPDWHAAMEPYCHIEASAELEVTAASGSERRTYVMTLTSIQHRSNYTIGRVLVFKDITDRKRMEEQMRHANQVKSQFLATVSHEIRTPLNAVINFNQFVSSGLYGDVSEKQKDALEKSTRSARHLLSLINDVLDLSKIEAERMELYIEDDVDIHAEVVEVIETARSLVAAKPIALLLDVEPDLPRTRIDRRRVRQVLLNLLSNAAKFTETGHIRLGVRLHEGALLVTVEDTGPGIPVEEQDMIFEAFHQLQRERRSGNGTGLGLPIARKLVEAHGGRLWFHSMPSKGTTFYFTLPINRSEIILQEASQ